jgi:Xaa-Pro aminopeptidase
MSDQGRIDRVRARLEAQEVDALLVTNSTNVRYLTGFSGTNGQVLVSPAEAVFFTDPRYETRAAELVQGAEVVVYPSQLTEVLPVRLASTSVSRLGFESTTMTVAQRDDLSERLSGVELVATTRLVEDLRRVKDSTEVELVRQATAIADDACEWILERLAVGRTERDVALELEVRIRRSGADDVSFEPIVATGPLSAHIHHTPTDRVMERGDMILLDFGARVEGYCSDLTRSVVLGPATDAQKDVYRTVLEAQIKGIEAVAPRAAGADVDSVARDIISEAGHGDAFGHGLGHGVGLDIHEAPRLHRASQDALVAGDVVTVEPGIYNVGWGGIRIEDCVLVTSDGREVLSRAPKEDLLEAQP